MGQPDEVCADCRCEATKKANSLWGCYRAGDCGGNMVSNHRKRQSDVGRRDSFDERAPPRNRGQGGEGTECDLSSIPGHACRYGGLGEDKASGGG